MATRLLLIDDDRELAALLTELLGSEGFEIDVHSSGLGAVAKATSGTYALIILDVMLPEETGLDVLREVRRTSPVPIILLTARGDDVDRIVGLEIGADDYVQKPFNPRELAARIRAVLRRLQPRMADAAGRGRFSVDDVTLDAGARRVVRAGQPVELTSVEFDILRVLLESAGETVAREALSEQVLGRRFEPFDRSIDMHVSKLRRKLGERPDGERIKTVRGAGYIYARLPQG